MPNDHATYAPVFLVGASRSGTTLLRLMLNEHPGIAIPSESHFLGQLLMRFGSSATLSSAELDEAVDLVVGFPQWQDDFGHTPEELRAAIGGEPLPISEFVNRVFRLEVGDARARWGDKSPPYLRWVDALLTCFPEGQVIAIVRDPRDVFFSLEALGWFGGTTWSIGRYLAQCGDFLERWSGEFPVERFRIVRYEDLVLDTERVLRALCEYLGLPFVAEMQVFFRNAETHVPPREIASHHAKLLRPPSPEDVERWRNSRAWLKLAEIEALTANVMRECGYERRTNDLADGALRAEARARHHLQAPLPAIKRNVEHVQRRLRKVLA